MTERLHIRPATEADLAALIEMTRTCNDYLDRMVWRKNTEAIAFYESLGAVADEESAVFEWRIN